MPTKSLWEDKHVLKHSAYYQKTQFKLLGSHNTTPWYGQYLTHAHSHITRAMAAMESCFGLKKICGLIDKKIEFKITLDVRLPPPPHTHTHTYTPPGSN